MGRGEGVEMQEEVGVRERGEEGEVAEGAPQRPSV